jgi:hypothetical protein
MNLGGAGQLSSYLMAPLSIYSGAGKIIPVPNEFDEASRLDLDSSILPTLRSADRFVLITRDTPAYNNWITARLP